MSGQTHTHTHTHTQDNYCNPRCACTPRVNKNKKNQLKMAAPAEVSKKRSNFRIRQFREKRHFNIAANLTFNTMVSFIILLIARTARIECPDRHTHTQDNYCNPRCACTPRVNKNKNNQLKMATPAEVSKKRSNFRIRQF